MQQNRMTPQMEIYFNTTNLTGELLRNRTKKAGAQTLRVYEFFRERPLVGYTPCQVWQELQKVGDKCPLYFDQTRNNNVNKRRVIEETGRKASGYLRGYGTHLDAEGMNDTRKSTRMYCDICGHLHKIDFAVPDEIWDACIHPKYKKAKLCLNCFMERADEQVIEWDKQITFSPCSLYTQIKIRNNETD